MYEDTGRKKTQLLNCDLTIILEITIIPEYNCTGNFLMLWICENTILPKFLESLYQDKVPAIKINICQQDKVKATEVEFLNKRRLYVIQLLQRSSIIQKYTTTLCRVICGTKKCSTYNCILMLQEHQLPIGHPGLS